MPNFRLLLRQIFGIECTLEAQTSVSNLTQYRLCICGDKKIRFLELPSPLRAEVSYSCNAVKRQLSDLYVSNKIDHTLQTVFKSGKICEDLKMCESKPPIISQMRCVQV